MVTTQAHIPLANFIGERQLRMLSDVLQSIEPAFDGAVFLAAILDDLESLTLMERVRRASSAIVAVTRTLSGGYDATLVLLKKAAPRLGRGLVSLTHLIMLGSTDGAHSIARWTR
jgi:hypothetical protein